MVRIGNLVFASGISFALQLVIGCSPVRPNRLSGRSNVSSDSSSDSGSTDAKTTTPVVTIDVAAIREVSAKILASGTKECSTAVSPAVGSIRLLTKVEYNNTIRDVLNVATNYASSFPTEQRFMGFKNNASINVVSDTHMDAYLTSAKAIAKDVVPANLQALVGCAATEGESCATKLINTLGPKLWRRQLLADENTRLLSLFKSGAASGNEAALQLLLSGMLSSANFLYRAELGNNGTLSAYETANLLSYFFWSSVPDDELRKLADSGEILKNEVQLAQAKRLLASVKTKSGLTELADALLFYDRFLSVPKDAAKFPQYSNEVRDALSKEVPDTFDYWVRVKDIKFGDMFTADYSAGGAALVSYYGAAPIVQNSVPLLNFASTKRRGVLGLGSVMASLATSVETNPIKRGVFVREHLLCEILPQPVGLDIKPVPIQQGLTTRERFAAHTVEGSCKACHIRIDGVGFGMEDYDAVGQFRSMDSGKPLDASGKVFDLDGKDSTFSGTDGLSNLLKDSETAKRCFVLQAFREASGRFEKDGDVCSIRTIANQFIQKDLTLAEVLIQIITDPDLTKRKGL